MKMQKRKFRIGELARQLQVERFVIRFWEKEFCVKTNRSRGGQRFYDEDDLRLFSRIKELLYFKGFTIAGAKKQLLTQAKAQPETRIIASQRTTITQKEAPTKPDASVDKTIKNLRDENARLSQQIVDLQKHLLKLRELL
jgi:DNA-binding transcriptional MerR regulator